MFSALSKAISGISSIISAKYYVTQQLAQMQAHNMNRESIIEKARGPTKTVIEKIFKEYDTAILANQYAWVKHENKLYIVKLKDGKTFSVAGGQIIPCGNNVHYGIFPPTAAISAALEECKSRLDFDKEYYTGLTEEVKQWAKTYNSNIEYWILTLEALLQDMAI